MESSHKLAPVNEEDEEAYEQFDEGDSSAPATGRPSSITASARQSNGSQTNGAARKSTNSEKNDPQNIKEFTVKQPKYDSIPRHHSPHSFFSPIETVFQKTVRHQSP